jgi:LmbE family N-acetylglucosaminyl deacetylase
VFVPLGIGSHVDHQLVFETSRCLAAQGVEVYAYEDCPYAIHTLEGRRTRLAVLDSKVGEPVLVPVGGTLEQRLEAIACYACAFQAIYASQVPVIFRFTQDFRGAVTGFAHEVGGELGPAERCWPVLPAGAA